VPRPTHWFIYILQNDRFATFWGRGLPKMGPVTLTFSLRLDICTLNLPTKSHHPMFNRSEVIVLTKKQTNTSTKRIQSDIYHDPLCYADGEQNTAKRSKIYYFIYNALLSQTAWKGEMTLWHEVKRRGTTGLVAF